MHVNGLITEKRENCSDEQQRNTQFVHLYKILQPGYLCAMGPDYR